MSSIYKPQKVKKLGFQTKLLPYTPFVSSWPYRTDIFDIARWENRPKTDTWVQEVENWRNDHQPLPDDITELLINVAKMVDELEGELHTNPRLQKACGFCRNGKATPIGETNRHPFLPTNLLDVLLWAAFDDTEPASRKLTLNPYHPELGLKNPWHPSSTQIASRFVDFSGKRVNELTDEFLTFFLSTFPTYSPAGRIPSASLSTIEGDPSNATIELQGEVAEHPSRWKDNQEFLAHANIAANAMNSKATAQASIVSCNLWVLISSLIFLIKSQDKEYGERFAHANRFMVLDSRAQKMLDWYFMNREDQDIYRGREGEEEEEGEEEAREEGEHDQELGNGAKPKGKGKAPRISKESHFASQRLVLAAAALCHSPIFVLNPLVDLSRQNEARVVPYHELSLRNIFMSSFEPLNTNTRATATEKVLWRLIIRTIAQCLSSKTLDSQVTESQSKSLSDILLHTVLKEELSKQINSLESLTQEFCRLERSSSLSHPEKDDTIRSPNVMDSASASTVLRRSIREPAKKTGSHGHAANEGKAVAHIENTAQDRRRQGQNKEDDDTSLVLPQDHRRKPFGNCYVEGDVDEPVVTILEDGEEDEEDNEEDEEDNEEDEEEEADDLIECEEVVLSLTNPPSPPRSKSTRKLQKSCSQKKAAWKPRRVQKRHVDIEIPENEGTPAETQQLRVPKRKCVHFEDDDEVEPAVKKPRKVSDTTYSWTTHVDIKLEKTDQLQPVTPESPQLSAQKYDFTPIWEDDVVNDDQDEPEDDSKISVIRHVLLPDGNFHRETITFTVAWPDNYPQKQYFWSILKNSRPAEVSEGYVVLGTEKISNNMNSASGWPRSILPLSHFDCLEARKLNPQELEQRELLLASSPLLILRPRTREAIRDAYTLPILDSEDIFKNLLVNVCLERQVHDSRKLKRNGTFKHLRAGSIQQVINQDRRAMNMLDIPNPNLTLPNFIRKLSLDSLGGPLTEGTGFPFTTMNWNLCATQPAVTELHYDSGKVATWIHMLRGTKIWFVLDGDVPGKGLAECDPNDLKFVYYVLEEGSIFTMPPGTVHSVLNVTDCFAEGGHMFLKHGLRRSFHNGLREHLHALQDTNTIHIEPEAVLHGIWMHFYLMIVNEHEWIKGSLGNQQVINQGEITYQSLREKINSLPQIEDMVALLCMCVHAMAFEPQVGKLEQTHCPESLKVQRIQSRERAEECIFWFNDLWEPLLEYESKITANLKKSPFNIEAVGVEYVINPMIDPKVGRPKKVPIHLHRNSRKGKKRH